MSNQEIKTAVKEEFFQNWLKDNQEIAEGEEDPCAGLVGEALDLCKKKQSLDEGLAHPAFAEYLNKQIGSTKYYAGKLQIKELKEKADAIENERARAKEMKKSFVSFLTTNPAHAAPAGEQAVTVLSKAEVQTATAESTSASVIQCLRQDSLGLALGIFKMLGFIAVGCGVLLFLLGPMVSRWMHGIK